MEDYTLSLALFDYVPVMISALGMYWLADILSRPTPGRRPLLLLAVALIAAGGLSKASWKLLWVVTGNDFALLNHLLFVLMVPGFLLLACHLYRACRYWDDRPAGADPLQLAIPLIVLVLGAALAASTLKPDSRLWFFLLLGTVSLCSITISLWLCGISWRLGARFTACLFLLSILLTLSLSGLARVSPGVAALQWVAEFLNTLAHGTTALALWRLRPLIPLRQVRV